MKTSLKLLCSTVAMLASMSLFASTGNAGIKNVKCSSGQSLQTAITNASAGDVLNISGTCDDGPYFIRKNVSLAGPAILSAADGSFAVLSVVGANIGLSNLDFDADGADHGVLLQRSTALVYDIFVENALEAGLQVDSGSAAQVDNSDFHNNKNGVRILRSSNGDLNNNEIVTATAPPGAGISVDMSSSATIGPGNVVDGYPLGILVWRNSSAFLINSTIKNSSNIGLLVQFSGFLSTTSQPSTFENNRLDVQCDTMGMIDVSGPQIGDPGTTYDDGTCAIPNPIF